MRNRDKDKKLARKLAELSVDGQRVTAERVQAVLAYLREKQPPRHRQVLMHYLHIIKREYALSHAIVETAGTLSEQSLSQIEAVLSSRYARPVQADKQENAELIAGIRIHIGDDVWEDTVASKLESLAHA